MTEEQIISMTSIEILQKLSNFASKKQCTTRAKVEKKASVIILSKEIYDKKVKRKKILSFFLNILIFVLVISAVLLASLLLL